MGTKSAIGVLRCRGSHTPTFVSLTFQSQIQERYVEEFLGGSQQRGGIPDQRRVERSFATEQEGAFRLASGQRLETTPHMRALPSFLHSFFDERQQFLPVEFPDMGLTPLEKMKIQQRSRVLGHHLFAERDPNYVENRMRVLLGALQINPDAGRGSSTHYPVAGDAVSAGHIAASRGWANEFDGSDRATASWADEYQGQRHVQTPTWAREYSQQNSRPQWAEEYAQASLNHQVHLSEQSLQGQSQQDRTVMQEQSRAIAETLASSTDPRMQNSQFLHFISKMSRGGIDAVGDPLIQHKGSTLATADAYASEFEASRGGWAEEFQGRGERWAAEFDAGEGLPTHGGWADEFIHNRSRVQVGTEEQWANEFLQHLEGDSGPDMASVAASYRFAENNPYDSHTAPLEEGKRLFREGILNESILALEAECKRNQSPEAWRLLGNVHAENDDDEQAIAALANALQSNPRDLEVMLSLGVSHTNELDQAQALSFLNGWLDHHPRYNHVAKTRPPEFEDESQRLRLTIQIFLRLTSEHPGDADVHEALGVLYNLSRDFDRAIEEFREALHLRPSDYSLWNKIGASQANSSRSREAIHSYRRALELKPNYVRAWSNLGISYANLGDHASSVRYYVRALQLHPHSKSAWGYLRMSLACLGRQADLVHVDERQLAPLVSAYPLST